jgi:Transcription termination factor nusG
MQNAGWCVVMSKPAAEEIAERSIREAGYRVYLPCYRKILRGSRFGEDGRRIRSRRDEVVLRPLFPLYLFVELCPHQQWSPVDWREARPRR